MSAPGSSRDLGLRDARLGYPGHCVLHDVDVTFAAGRRVGVLGRNGSGKTTLLRTLLGILPPLGGSVLRPPGLRLGFVPQRERFDPVWPLTVREVVFQGLLPDRGLFARPTAADDETIAESLARVGLAGRAAVPFRDLSGGQQQKVLLARALARRPDWLILDEPTAGLDVPAQQATLELVESLHSSSGDMGVVLVSHQLSDLVNGMDAIAFVGRGTVELAGVEEAFDEARLTRFYGAPVRCLVHEGYRTVVPVPGAGAEPGAGGEAA